MLRSRSLFRPLTSRLYSALVVDSPYGSLDYPQLSIPEFVWENIEKWPDHTALVCGATGRKYSYAEARGMAHNFATSLVDAGFKPGQVLSIVLPNVPEYAVALLGALEAGLVVSTINPIYSPEEIGFQLGNSGSRCVVTYPDKARAVEKGSEVAKAGGLPLVLVGGGTDSGGARSFAQMAQRKSSTVLHPPNPGSLALLPYSSGTTGLPKGVKLTHMNVVANNTQISHPSIRFAYDTTKDYQDVIPCVLPFFHIYGMTVGMLSYLRNGSKLVTLPRFEPEAFLKVLKDYKSTVVHVVPPLVQFLGSHPAVNKSHLDTVRAIVNGAASVSVTDAEKLLTKKQVMLISGYGLTETSPAITSASNSCTDLATVGKPLSDTQIKIVNTETGEIMDSSQPGEVCCRGPQVMEGYHKNDAATAETLKDGWLHTGDVGYFDKDGQMFIVDRIKELIKVKGFQVAPLELEEILRSHPGIADCGVVGKPETKSGEVPVAFVVVKTGSRQPSTHEIKEFVAGRVADYKRLDSVIFVSAIPKNTTGKILRKELRESLAKV